MSDKEEEGWGVQLPLAPHHLAVPGETRDSQGGLCDEPDEQQ